MKQKILHIEQKLLGDIYARFRPSFVLQGLLFHKIFPTRKNINYNNGYLSEQIDVGQLEGILKYFKNQAYTFIDENDIISGKLKENKKYVYLTFDDGYYSNYLILPLLEKYKAKATFFISTNQIEEEKSFWWDAQVKYRKKENKSEDFIKSEYQHIFQLHWKEQEEYIISNMGKDALYDRTELLRPMTSKELQEVAHNPLITLGNHTTNHLCMLNYSETELLDSLINANQFLEKIVDYPIQSVAYPYGRWKEDKIINATKEAKLKLGITCKPHSLKSIKEVEDRKLTLSRKAIWGNKSIEEQLQQIKTKNTPPFSLISYVKQKTTG